MQDTIMIIIGLIVVVSLSFYVFPKLKKSGYLTDDSIVEFSKMLEISNLLAQKYSNSELLKSKLPLLVKIASDSVREIDLISDEKDIDIKREMVLSTTTQTLAKLGVIVGKDDELILEYALNLALKTHKFE